MREGYNPNKIGTPSCAAEAGISSWQHDANQSYGKGEWRISEYQERCNDALIRTYVAESGWVGNTNPYDGKLII